MLKKDKGNTANFSTTAPVSVSDNGLIEINVDIFIFYIPPSLASPQYYGHDRLITTLSDVAWLWVLSAVLWVSLVTLRYTFRE